MQKFNLMLSAAEEDEVVQLLQEQEKQGEKIVNSFWTERSRGWRANEQIECADNRRAAGVYIANF